jgi:hypothetical protein
MKLKADPEADARYLRPDDSWIMEPQEVAPGGVLDFNERKQAVGVESKSLALGTLVEVPGVAVSNGLKLDAPRTGTTSPGSLLV